MNKSEQANNEQEIEDFVHFLEGKTAEEIVEIYRTMSGIDFSGQVMAKFNIAMKQAIHRDQELTLQVARLLIHDKNPAFRLGCYNILKPLMMSEHPEARSVLWEELLSDEDPIVFDQAYLWLSDIIYHSEDISLANILYLATWFRKAKDRWDSSR